MAIKLYLHANKTNGKEYTLRLIDHVLRPYMVADPARADYVLVSLCDISELSDIARARCYGRPVIAGGMVAEYPVVNELADYTWHGEVYGLRKLLDQGLGLDDMPSISSRQRRRLVIDQDIRWDVNPIIGVGSRARYYYVSKGCPVACKYCYIGNVRKYQAAPEALYKQALQQCGRHLMPIAAYNPYQIPDRANIGETLLRRYIQPGYDCTARMIRSGVEFCLPQYSRDLAKGVTVEHLNEALAKSKRNKTTMILYYIAGIDPPEAIDDFFGSIAVDYATAPMVKIVFTYIDPQPFTPMHDLDLRRKRTDYDSRRIYYKATQVNKRLRVMPTAPPAKSTFRTLLGRCRSVDDYRRVMRVKRLDHNAMLDDLSGEEELLGRASIDEICARPRRAISPDYWVTEVAA